MSSRPTKYVFVTGGVVSALGKGIVAASLGRLLKARGLNVQAQKFDPYLNVDPGTMSPFQHGEVFVTEVFDLYFVASGAVSKHDSESWPRLRNARIKMQRRASNSQSQNAFDAGALHPSRGARIPSPAATPDVRRDSIDIRGNNIRFNFVTVDICPGSRVIDRIEEREQTGRLVALA